MPRTASACSKPRPRSGRTGCCRSTPTSASMRGRARAAPVPRGGDAAASMRVRVQGSSNDRRPHHYDRADLWVCRLFAFEPGQPFCRGSGCTSFPCRRRSRRRWLRTTMRIRTVASLTAERRRARFEKYREADPATRVPGGLRRSARPPASFRVGNRRPGDGSGARRRRDARAGSEDDEDLDLDRAGPVGDRDRPGRRGPHRTGRAVASCRQTCPVPSR